MSNKKEDMICKVCIANGFCFKINPDDDCPKTFKAKASIDLAGKLKLTPEDIQKEITKKMLDPANMFIGVDYGKETRNNFIQKR